MSEQEALLDHYHNLVNSTILCHQHPVTGLLPSAFVPTGTDPQENQLKSHAWVRDNVYTSLCVWGLSLAHKKSDDPLKRAQSYELEKSVVKSMRGLLRCLFQQSDKVEEFKKTQHKIDSLHAKYDMSTGGTACGDDEWGHLQIDATSLYILMLAQMTASGIQLIYTLDEVCFVQNLVYYIEVAYRIPDYGVWERGDKTNHGYPELNASSIGMAKAALESISELDLFGARGGPSSVIHVMIDEVRRNEAILEALLPRESNSKETGSSLLSIISFPAFAVEDGAIIAETRNCIIEKLQGNYGFKRFLRDGYQTAVENRSRLYYEPAELQVFDSIECEWPMFFCYMLLDSVFREDEEKVREYRGLIEKHLVEPCEEYFEVFNISKDSDGCGGSHAHLNREEHINTTLKLKVMPQLYYVQSEDIQAEYNQPHSQERVPSHKAPFFWGQSLFILSGLLADGLLSVGEIDPLNRRHILHPSSADITSAERSRSLRRTISKKLSLRNSLSTRSFKTMSSGNNESNRLSMTKRSSFYVSQPTDVVVQVCLLTKEKSLKKELQDFDIPCQTLDEIKPAAVLPPSELKKVYTYLGKSEKLGLSGRPGHDVGTLSVCKIYRMKGSLFLFTHPFTEKENFYLTFDNDLLEDSIRSQLSFIRANWRRSGRPTLTLVITRTMFKGNQEIAKSPMLKLLKALKGGYCNGTRVRACSLSRLLNTACIEDLTFLDDTAFAFDHEQRKLPKSYLNINESKSIMKSMRRSSVIVADVFHENRETIANANSLFEDKENSKLPTIYDDEAAHHVAEPYQPLQVSSSVGQQMMETETIPKHISKKDFHKVSVPMLCKYLQTLEIIQEQLNVLEFLHRKEGLGFNTDRVLLTGPTVGDLLEEIYRTSGELQMWFVVRTTAGLLAKQADNLAGAVTDILVMRKQISVGIPSFRGHQETFIVVPHSASKIQSMIQKACNNDPAICVLTEEILLFLAMFVRTEPQLFSEMLRVRVGLIIKVMLSELARNFACDEDISSEYLLRRSPLEMKNILRHILSGSEFAIFEGGVTKICKEEDIANAIGIASKTKRRESTLAALKEDLNQITDKNNDSIGNLPAAIPEESHENDRDGSPEREIATRKGQWLRRRQLDGALNRVPEVFYSEAWHVLKRCHGFTVKGHVLPHHPTVQEMTPGETKFAHLVETMLNSIVIPEYRQLTVEVMMLLAMIFKDQPTWFVGSVIDLDRIISGALDLFSQDLQNTGSNVEDMDAIMNLFYDNAPSGRHGSMTYLVEAIFRHLSFPSPESCAVQ